MSNPNRDGHWIHGLRSAFVTQGDESALTPEQRSRLQEIRAELMTPGGCRRMLEEHTAALGWLADIGFAMLYDRAKQDGGPAAFAAAETPAIIKALSLYRQACETLARLDTGGRR